MSKVMTTKNIYFMTAFCSTLILTVILLFNSQTISFAATNPTVTIDSHNDEDSLPIGTVRISGTYTDTINLFISVNGEKSVDVHMDSSQGRESGNWYYDLNTEAYDGDIIIYVKGNDSINRSGVSADMITLKVDNPAVNKPTVSVVNPEDGTDLFEDGICDTDESVSYNCEVPIKVSVESKNAVAKTQIRINDGQWKDANNTAKGYVFNWKVSHTEDTTYSIEARAIDANGNEGISSTTYVRVGEGIDNDVTVSGQDRAMWIWENASYSLFLNPGSRNFLKAFAEDSDTFDSNPIKTLYVGIDVWNGIDILKDEPSKVRDFLSWAHDNDFEVHATIAGGTSPPYLGALKEFHSQSVAEIEKIINYNISSSANERFDGVNIDIEPYIMPEFGADKPRIQTELLDVLEKMINRRDEASVNLSIGPAIPRWYDTSPNAVDITWKGKTKLLSEHIQDISDYIAIMNYRDTADGGAGLIEQVQNEMDYANKIGKPNSVVLGVETKDIASTADPEVVTFSEEGRSHMENELNKTYSHYEDDDAFAGMAVHMYNSIKTMPSSWANDRYYWTPPSDDTPPSALTSDPIAKAFNYQQIDLSFGRATDNLDVAGYNIYRSTDPDFTPDASNLVTTVKGLSYTDKGLLSSTQYYYRVAAVDHSHNLGPASAVTTAKTGETDLKPLIIDENNITYTNGNVVFQLQVIDKETNEAISDASVHGRFTYGAGKYINTTTDSEGFAIGTSEPVESDKYQVGFQTDRIVASGYYWAYSVDKTHTAEYNLVKNSGFENKLKEWTKPGAQFTSDENDVYNGRYALRLKKHGNTSQLVTGIFPGETYTLQGVAKTIDSDQGVTFGVISLDQNGSEIPEGSFSMVIDSETYEKQTLTFTAVPNTKSVKVYVKKNVSSGVSYVDDIELRLKSLPDHQVSKR